MFSFLTKKSTQHKRQLTPPERTVVLQPFSQIETINVIINLENKTCLQTVVYLDKKAAAYGIEIKYLIYNPNAIPLPIWALKPNMRAINYKIDFNSSGDLLTDEADSFMADRCDLLLSITNDYRKVIEIVALNSRAKFKIGRKFTKDNPYDLAVMFNQYEKDNELAYEFLSFLYILTKEDSTELNNKI